VDKITEFESYDGLGLAELVRTKAVTADELLDAAEACMIWNGEHRTASHAHT
jgi:hypothetical protein